MMDKLILRRQTPCLARQYTVLSVVQDCDDTVLGYLLKYSLVHHKLLPARRQAEIMVAIISSHNTISHVENHLVAGISEPYIFLLTDLS